MNAKKSKSIKIENQVENMINDFSTLIDNMQKDSNRFADYYKETTGLELSKFNNKGEITENDIFALAFSLAKKQLQNAVNQNVISKNLATTKNLGNKKSNDAEQRLGKFVESIMVHNRNKNKTTGNGAIGSIFVNSTILRREGNFNADLVNRFIDNGFTVNLQGKKVFYSDIENELKSFGIDKNFNNILRTGLKSNEICVEILEVVKKNYAI
jgi:hypothetical protein